MIISDCIYSFSYFLLDQKVTKNQGLITMLAVLSQRYLLAIQGMKKYNKSLQFALLVYCYAHAIRTYLRLRTASAFL